MITKDSLEENELTKALKRNFVLKSYFFICIILLIFSAYFHFLANLKIHAQLCISFFIGFISVYLVAKTGKLRLPTLVHFQNFFLMTIVTFIFFVSGGLKAPVLFWIPTVSYATLNLIGRKAMIFWLSIGILTSTVFLVLELNGVSFENLQFESNRYKIHYIHLILISLYTLSISLLKEKMNNENSRVQLRLTQNIYHQNKLASMGKIVAGVSHEINNPLTIVNGNIYILQNLLQKENITNPDILKSLNTIDNANQRIVNIVKSLRGFSKKENTEDQYSNINEVLKEILALVESEYKKYGIEIKAPLNSTDHEIKGSRSQLQQVVLNILSNSKDALETKKDKNIEIMIGKESNLKLELIITDNGQGISDENLDKVLDPFFTTKSVHEGTGLGLSIANNIIEGLGGEIKIKSQKNEGTSICITLIKRSLS